MQPIQLSQYKIQPNHTLGQNFLTNQKLLACEVDYAQIQPEDVVLEIGPGIGNLTERLLQKASKVIAVEKDTQFHPCLTDLQKRHPHLEILWQDALTVSFPPVTKVVSNLPFQVALPLTFKILQSDFRRAVLIYQQSLAEKICALPGEDKYSRISVQMQRLANPKFLQFIPKTDFHPAPEVDSALIALEKIPPKFVVASEAFFKQALDFFFFQRDLPLKDVLFGLGKNPPEKLTSLLSLVRHLQNEKISRITPLEFGIIVEAVQKCQVKLPFLSDGKKKKAQKKRKKNS